MDKEKEINKIAPFLIEVEYCRNGSCDLCTHKDFCDDYQKARSCAISLIQNGIGDKKQAVKEFAEWVIDLLYANSVANESEQHTHIASTPEELQDEINAKLKELYGAET